MLRKLHKYANPNKFSLIIMPIKNVCLYTALPLIAIGLIIGLFFSPPDYQQGETVRIMYIHVSSAWISLFAYVLIFFLSVFYLIWKFPLFVLMAKEIPFVAIIFTLITLITGSLWGKPTWGTYWVWDARITSTFILLIQYIGLLALRTSFNTMQTTDQILSIVAIVGAINIPIIKFSVNWWNTLHQNASITFSGSSIDAEMLYVLPLMLISFGFIAFSIFGRNIQSEIIIRQGSSKKIGELING